MNIILEAQTVGEYNRSESIPKYSCLFVTIKGDYNH